MILDTYSYCPGGTGKKFKHCACRDIAGELDKIIKSIEGDQRIAALDRINRTLATKANRPCLLSLKIMTLLDMKDMQALEDTVTTFVKVAPDNPLAHTFAAVLESRKHRVREAVDELQTAISLVKDVLPGELYDALGEVAEALAESGEYLAARAHLMMRVSLGGDDKEAARPLIILSNAERVPPVLKRNLMFEPLSRAAPRGRDALRPPTVTWSSGGWKKGLEKFEKLNQDFPYQPAILWNIAVARSYLALPRLPEAWHAYARCPGVEFQQAVEAEALAQLLSIGRRQGHRRHSSSGPSTCRTPMPSTRSCCPPSCSCRSRAICRSFDRTTRHRPRARSRSSTSRCRTPTPNSRPTTCRVS